MSKTIYRVGFVTDGAHKGRNIYKADENSFIIVGNDENGKIIIRTIFATTGYNTLKEISKATVDHYEEVGASKTGADAGAVATGLLMAGPVGALIGAAASRSESYDLAVYFKDGTKSLIRLTNSVSYQEMKRILFVL